MKGVIISVLGYLHIMLHAIIKSLKKCLVLKFELSEKHTKLKKNLPHGFDKSVDLLIKRQNNEEDFFQIMCASQKVRTLCITAMYGQDRQ